METVDAVCSALGDGQAMADAGELMVLLVKDSSGGGDFIG